MAAITTPADFNFMYKIVANNVIMKFPVTLKTGFDIEKDEVKFGFYLTYEMKVSESSKKKIKVPIMINTGKLKINNTGGNYVSSAQSVASAKKVSQEQKLATGQAQMLDHSYVSAASVKEKMDESFQSTATTRTHQTNQSMTSQQSAAHREAVRQAQINQQRKLDQMNASMRSDRPAKDKE